jgi:hypothetical protein
LLRDDFVSSFVEIVEVWGCGVHKLALRSRRTETSVAPMQRRARQTRSRPDRCELGADAVVRRWRAVGQAWTSCRTALRAYDGMATLSSGHAQRRRGRRL